MTDDQTQNALVRKNARMGLILVGVIVFMIGLSFASVPLYRLFCQVTGYGGTTQTAQTLPDVIIDRTITVKFTSSTSRNMAWDFKPEDRAIDVRLGQKGVTAFQAYNPLDAASSGTAIYNVTPLKAGKYFHKVQCFCFDQQTLQAQQRVSMPVMFYIDPAMHDDANMDDVQTITLSYTFFPAESEELDEAVEGFYNSGENITQTDPKQRAEL